MMAHKVQINHKIRVKDQVAMPTWADLEAMQRWQASRQEAHPGDSNDVPMEGTVV